MQLYDKNILRWSTKLDHIDPIVDFDKEINRRSRVCGNHMSMRAKVKNNVITDFSWDISLCALGQAAAAILSQHLVGLSREEYQTIDSGMRQMVQNGVIDLPAKFADLSCLSVVHDHPGRWSSVLLPFDCLAELFHLEVESAPAMA